MKTAHGSSPSDAIRRNIPFLRRYARALCGSQESGDAYAAAALEAILASPEAYDTGLEPKAALFAVFHRIWTASGSSVEVDETGLPAKAQAYLNALTVDTREALLLRTIEEFPTAAVAVILGVSEVEAQALIDIAYEEMAKAVSGTVMIIEDEAIIALDLEAIVADMGHRATGVARTEAGALQLFAREEPDLILSDIQLADGSSGADAVGAMLAGVQDVPVIFVTAFPEVLLTGEGREPAFIITKPYSEEQVRSAISQAMFFSSTEPLRS